MNASGDEVTLSSFDSTTSAQVTMPAEVTDEEQCWCRNGTAERDRTFPTEQARRDGRRSHPGQADVRICAVQS